MAKLTRRRRAAWGSLQYDQRTRTARIRYWAEGPDGYRRRSKTLRDVTRREAEAERAQLMLDHGDDSPCPTVAQVWERWALPTYERRVREGDMSANTLAAYRSAYRTHVAPRWADVPCDEVRALDVQQWISDGRTLKQAQSGLKMLSAVLDLAANYECVDANVCRTRRYVMPSKSTVSERDKGVWTLDELGELWRHVWGQPFESAFLLSAFGSCRLGESLAVTAPDVGRREVDGVMLAVARIDKQVPQRGREIVHATKTERSTRSVVVAGHAAERLLWWADRADGGFLTNDGLGRCMTQATLNHMWRACVPPSMLHPFRNLRNSWQTNMRWEMRMPPHVTEPMMGHVGRDVTGVYYDRPQVEMFCDAVASAYAEHPYDAKWDWLKSANWDD